MRLTPASACLGTLLSLTLLSCQPFDQLQQLAPDPAASRADPYFFTGNPGIRTTGIEDISGTLTGTIDGQSIAFGPDKGSPVRARAGYNDRQTNASVLSVQVDSDQYSISLYVNGPFEAGRSYHIYNSAADGGEGKFDPYIVTPFVRIPEGQFGRDLIDLTTPDERVTITAITAEYIDIEFLFTLSKPGAVQERINIRVKNVVDENRNLRAASEGEPFWNYTNVSRMIDAWGYLPRQGNAPPQPTTTRVQIEQRQLTTPTSDISYEGKTNLFTGQTSSLYQLKQPTRQTYVECSFSTAWSATGWKQLRITWPSFTGVGTYTADQVMLSFINDQGNAGSWQVLTSKSTSPTARWQVEVQKVTPEVIEGTYTLVDVPPSQTTGSGIMPISVNASGRFKIIYPR